MTRTIVEFINTLRNLNQLLEKTIEELNFLLKELYSSLPEASKSPGPANCNIRKKFQNEKVKEPCERCEYGPCPFFNKDGSFIS